MLLQFPFFIAFFNVMPYLVDLNGASFLWISNLARPDTIFTIPFFPNQINLLPIIMTVVMAIQTLMQQKTQPATGATGSGMQMKIFTFILPVVFLFITYYAPAGLTLYWTFSILFGIVQQMLFNYLTKRKKENDKVEVLDTKGKPIKRKK
jgi:YidC/Oxa1 family membrane protein insertase